MAVTTAARACEGATTVGAMSRHNSPATAAIEVALTGLRHPIPRPRLLLTQRFVGISRNRMGE
jgi:hypothetical protein